MRRLESLLANLFGTIFLVLAVVVTVETVVRKVFNFSLQGADELGGYSLAIGSTLAFALAVMGRNHIRVDVFHEKFPPRVQAAMNWLASVLLAALALLFVGVSLRVVRESFEYGSTAQTPWATPLAYPQSVWYAGLIVFALVATAYAVRATWLLMKGRTDALNHEFQPKSAKEELKDELEDLAARSSATAGEGK